jgi:sulfur-oxidizing protein SoxY
MARIGRRSFLSMGIGACLAAVSARFAPPAFANDAEELIRKFTAGKPVQENRVRLELPEIAENGNTVPMTISVESPMTEQSHVTDVLVVAEGNPRGGVVTFHFTPASGVAEANTRIRLAETQNVIALAKMNDGSVFQATKQVKVTIGGCGG